MVKAAAYTSSGAKASQAVNLPEAVFGEEVSNHQLLHEAIRAYQAELRRVSAKTKTRGQVRGGGRKPWKQKGLGKARAGSIRSPIWKGGGVTFGPTGEQNYRINLPKAARRLALRQALSLKAQAGAILVIDSLESNAGKTKDIMQLLEKLGVARKTLLVVDKPTPQLTRSTNNLTGVSLTSARYLNPYRVLDADQLVITKPVLSVIKDWLGQESAAKDTEASRG